MKTVCFTGRNPDQLGGYNKENYVEFMKWLYPFLEKLYSKGAREFITGGAQGFDQLVFMALNKLKAKYPDIKNILYVPFGGQEKDWAEEGLFSQKQYHHMLASADSINMVCNAMKNVNMTDRCLERNHRMVDDAEVLIVLWDGDFECKTGECVHYAQKKHKPVLQVQYDCTNGLKATQVNRLD